MTTTEGITHYSLWVNLSLSVTRLVSGENDRIPDSWSFTHEECGIGLDLFLGLFYFTEEMYKL